MPANKQTIAGMARSYKGHRSLYIHCTQGQLLQYAIHPFSAYLLLHPLVCLLTPKVSAQGYNPHRIFCR